VEKELRTRAPSSIRVALDAVVEELHLREPGEEPKQVLAPPVVALADLRLGDVVSPLRDAGGDAREMELG
jgi:hypothetical protein